MIFLLMLFWLSLFAERQSVHLPPSIKCCSKSDPNFVECVKHSMEVGWKVLANGSKELGIPTLDPFFVPKLVIDGSQSTGPISLQQYYDNVYVHGYSNVDIVDFSAEFDNDCKMSFQAEYPTISVKSNSLIKGKFMMFSLNMKGSLTTTYDNFHVNNWIVCEKYKKQGQVYLRLTNYTMDMRSKKMHFDFVNEATENREFYEQIIKTANDNYELLYAENKAPLEETFSMIFLKYLNSVFSKIPFNELFLD